MVTLVVQIDYMWYKLYFLLVIVLLCSCTPDESVRFGVISDVHKDIMHDADLRLGEFVSTMNDADVDFVIQLGDFCRPYDYNMPFMQIWNSFEGAGYHVIGNHEMDGGFSVDSVVRYFEMPARYYSFEEGSFHFIVLDGNEQNPSSGRSPGYSRYIGTEQLVWLDGELNSTDKHCIVFSHQSLAGDYGLENASQIRGLLEEANRGDKNQKVWACINGHHHANRVLSIHGIQYIDINSASYDWLGEAWLHESYSHEIHQEFPWISYTAPYRDALWADIELDPKGRIIIKGQSTEWVGPSPEELGHPGKGAGYQFSTAILDTILIMNQ